MESDGCLFSGKIQYLSMVEVPWSKTEKHRFPTRKEKTLDSLVSFVYDNTGNRNQVIIMEKIVQQGLLYDFYGELLTEHQRRVYEDVVIHDFSLSEIAQEQGISRQGVHDLIKRCDRLLAGYEQKLKLVEKFRQTKKMAAEIQGLLDEYTKKREPEFLVQARELAGKIGEV